MDAKSIWNTANTRTNYSSAHNLKMETKKKKKYKIINGKKVEDHSGLGLKKVAKFGNKLLKIITRTDGFNTYSKKDLEKIRNKPKNNKNPLKKFNYGSEENKRIRAKEKIIKSDKSSRKEKNVAKVQRSAIIRKRDGVKLQDVRDRQTKRIKDAAKKRNEQFKKTGKSTVAQRRADAKKKMQDAARKRNEAFKNKRKLKITKKRQKKDKYAGISTM